MSDWQQRYPGGRGGVMKEFKIDEKPLSHTYYQTHCEEIKSRVRAYRQAHREAIAKQKAQYYQANKVILTWYYREYREQNRDKHRQYAREHYKANKDRYFEAVNRRISLLRGATKAQFTANQWQRILERYDYRCAYCGDAGKLTMDHVHPLSRGGEHTAANIIPACPSCNRQKSTKTFLEYMFYLASIEETVR